MISTKLKNFIEKIYSDTKIIWNNTNEITQEEISSHIKISRKNIKIISGVLHDAIYNSNKVFNEFIEALNRGVKFKILVGPEFILSDTEFIKKISYLPEEIKKQIQIRQRRLKFVDRHIRIYDSDIITIESSHLTPRFESEIPRGFMTFLAPAFIFRLLCNLWFFCRFIFAEKINI